jgi:hypothetical protein
MFDQFALRIPGSTRKRDSGRRNVVFAGRVDDRQRFGEQAGVVARADVSPTTATGATHADEDSTSDDAGTDAGGGTIDVVLTGCDVDLGGTVVVSYHGSLGVASVYDSGATLSENPSS